MKQQQEEPDTFRPLGQDSGASEEAFLQWLDFIDQSNDDVGADDG